MRARIVGLTLALAACSSEPPEEAPPTDPFTGDVLTLPLGDPARAMAVLDARFVLAAELTSELVVIQVEAGALVEKNRLSVGSGPRGVAALDVNADGLVDLVSGDTSASTLSVLYATASGFSPAMAVATPLAPKSLAALDGDLLVVAGLGAETRVELWQSTMGVLVFDVATIALADADRCRTGDLDSDGAADAVVALPSHDQLALVTDHASTDALIDVCDTPIAARIADVDASGAGDVAVACTSEALLLLDPTVDKGRITLPVTGQLYDVAIADFDGDGWQDLAAVDVVEHTLLVWMAPLRQATLSGVHPVARGPVALEAADVDGDGDVDLALLAYEQRSFQVLINHAR